MRSTLVLEKNVEHKKFNLVVVESLFLLILQFLASLLWICSPLNPYLESASNNTRVSTIFVMHSGSLRDAQVHCTES